MFLESETPLLVFEYTRMRLSSKASLSNMGQTGIGGAVVYAYGFPFVHCLILQRGYTPFQSGACIIYGDDNADVRFHG